MYPENQRIIPTLIVSAGIGALLWGFMPGLMHFFVSVDFRSMHPSVSFPFRVVAFLWIIGALIGVVCQALAILGGYLRARGFIRFAPMLSGIVIGTIQGYLISTPLLGLEELGFAFRSPQVLMLAGGFCGLVAVPPVMIISVWVRRWMP
jgi:hypothetical protein